MYAIIFFGNVPAFWPAWRHFKGDRERADVAYKNAQRGNGLMHGSAGIVLSSRRRKNKVVGDVTRILEETDDGEDGSQHTNDQAASLAETTSDPQDRDLTQQYALSGSVV